GALGLPPGVRIARLRPRGRWGPPGRSRREPRRRTGATTRAASPSRATSRRFLGRGRDEVELMGPRGGGAAGVDAELCEDGGDVMVDGPDGHDQSLGDLLVGEAFADEQQDLVLAAGES